MKLLYSLSILLFSIGLNAQAHSTCDDDRYLNRVFEDIDSTIRIKYGEGLSINLNLKELFLDVFEPAGDQAVNRPLIIFAFGGAFISGEREDVHFLCREYARRGYVAAAIDYRLYDRALIPLPTPTELKEVVVKTVGDMKAAVRFFREDAATNNIFRIDPELIFSGGISAGAVVAAHAAVLDSTDEIEEEIMSFIEANGGYEGDVSDNYEYSSEVQGIVSYSGALTSSKWIDAMDPPLFSAHDDMDGTVPYGIGFANVFGQDLIEAEGSSILHMRADSLGIFNELITFENSAEHVGYFLNDQEAEFVVERSNAFLHAIICDAITADTKENSLDDVLTLYPNPSTGIMHIDYRKDMNASIVVTDLMGHKLVSLKNADRIDLSGFSKGYYFVKLVDTDTQDFSVFKVLLVN